MTENKTNVSNIIAGHGIAGSLAALYNLVFGLVHGDAEVWRTTITTAPVGAFFTHELAATARSAEMSGADAVSTIEARALSIVERSISIGFSTFHRPYYVKSWGGLVAVSYLAILAGEQAQLEKDGVTDRTLPPDATLGEYPMEIATMLFYKIQQLCLEHGDLKFGPGNKPEFHVDGVVLETTNEVMKQAATYQMPEAMPGPGLNCTRAGLDAHVASRRTERPEVN